jgi:thiaminase/transcriptional activator TenA
MTFCEELYAKAKHIWVANHKHPFVQGIGHGTLPKESFRHYMIQDYLYLIDYAKLFALGSVKATDVETMGKFGEILHSTLNVEMDLHRQYAKKFAISEEELENAHPASSTIAYTHYMLQVAQNGTLAELVAALLPCMWSYNEIGRELAKIPGALEHEFYGEWVEMYSSKEFGELSNWLKDLMNKLAIGKSGEERKKLEEIFLNTSRFEFLFWDMAYHGETWPEDIR